MVIFWPQFHFVMSFKAIVFRNIEKRITIYLQLYKEGIDLTCNPFTGSTNMFYVEAEITEGSLQTWICSLRGRKASVWRDAGKDKMVSVQTQWFMSPSSKSATSVQVFNTNHIILVQLWIEGLISLICSCCSFRCANFLRDLLLSVISEKRIKQLLMLYFTSLAAMQSKLAF